MATIELGYSARAQFAPFHRREHRWAAIVAHRRAGKTVACVMDALDAALRCEKPNPRFAYIAPLYTQAKDIAWTYVKQYGSLIPGASINESELRLDLPNGGRLRLYGADNYDRLRGLYFDGVVLDEYADMDPRVWPQVIRPALSDRQGWATFIGTPKGKNDFWRIWNGDSNGVWPGAVNSKDWFHLMLKASETGIVDEKELEDARSMLSHDEFAQEYECSFEAAIKGAYYARQIEQARNEGRIGRVARDPLLPTLAFWDIGIRDATAIWIAQFVGREIRVLDHYEAVGQPLGAHLDWLRTKGYSAAECVLPHDGAHQDAVTGIRFEDHIRQAGFRARTIQNQGKGAAMKRVEALRRVFPAIWFNEASCRAGLDALAEYHEKWDETRNVGLGPEHNWASHSSDAAGLMAVAYEEPRLKSQNSRASERLVSGWAA